MAEILFFPPSRRAGYLRKQAAFVLGMNEGAGDRHIQRQLAIQRDVLLSKGCDPAAVESAIADLHTALRAAMWRQMFRPGGAA